MNKISPRKAAHLAVLNFLQKGIYATQTLEEWRQTSNPSPLDLKFAREIAYGAIRMANSLDYIATQASGKEKLNLKPREKALLRVAAYQLTYMDRTPGYAIVNECVNIAKELGNPQFPGLLNAVLRKIADNLPELPSSSSADDLSIRLSYPKNFVEILLQDHGYENAVKIMEAGNSSPSLMARKRNSLEMVKVDDLEKMSLDPNYYIQNYTPAYLFDTLASEISPPAAILDLCAAPGGKLLAAHDKFPEAELFANELSKERIPKLLENTKKYDLKVNLSEGPGENFSSSTQFDLIVLDVPCSNTGVLNKRPEARWRVSEESIKDLNATQLALIANSAKLVSINGKILYLTCSILEEENQNLIEEACKQHNLVKISEQFVLPDPSQNHDGGYACLLQKK